MKEIELTREIIREGSSADEGYFEYAAVAARRLPKRLHAQLQQIINGPIFDGDLISKSQRSELIDMELALTVCVKGQQGFTGATYFAYTVMKIVRNTQ